MNVSVLIGDHFRVSCPALNTLRLALSICTPIISRFFWPKCRSWVKTGKPRSEQMSSAVHTQQRTLPRYFGMSVRYRKAVVRPMSDVRQVPSRVDVFSRRDSARNNRLGLKNLNDVAALVYRTAEKDYRAAIGSRARRRNFNDFALAAKPLKNVRSTACFTRSLTAQAARLELPVARCSAALFRASMALTEFWNALSKTRLPMVPSTKPSPHPLRFLPSRTTTTSMSVVPLG